MANRPSRTAGRGIPSLPWPLALAVLLIGPAACAPRDRDAKFPLHPPDFVYVCRDAGAGAYEAFPDVCRLADGRLLAVFYAGYGHVSLPDDRWPSGGRISGCYSGDGGRTWSAPFLVYDGPDDDRDPSVVELRSGRLLCTFFSLRKGSAAGAETVPWRGLGSWIIASDDHGRTWSAPRRIAVEYYCSSPVRELPDGRLILGLYRQDETGSRGAVTASDDGGMTWAEPVDIPNGGYRLDAETDVIPLRDGSLYAIQREPETTMCWSVSKDGGRSWSVSRPVGFPGHCPYLLRAPGDIILLAHRLPRTSLHYSFDEGRTWSANVMIDDVPGAYPSMALLGDGSVLVVYYEEGEGSDIRARRFQAMRDGIVWLTF